MTRSPERRRALRDDERTLWSHAMRDVKPLGPTPTPSPRTAPAGRVTESSAPEPSAPALRESAGVPAAPPALRPDRSLAIDKRTLARLKRGDMPIDGRLDLHGLTQARAHEALDRFVDGGLARGARLLLVITGKGSGGDGVLRSLMPRWLRAGPHATRILRVEPAHLRHGGSGAWYVYLRRRRDQPGTRAP